jgi:hypothetical protein
MFKEHYRKLCETMREVDICTQVYYSFIETIRNFEDKSRYPNYVGKSICRFFRPN